MKPTVGLHMSGEGGYISKNGNYLFNEPGQPESEFKKSDKELVITFARNHLAIMKKMSEEQTDDFELLAYNVELQDFQGIDFPGIARLKVLEGKTMNKVIENLKAKVDLKGWQPVLIETKKWKVSEIQKNFGKKKEFLQGHTPQISIVKEWNIESGNQPSADLKFEVKRWVLDSVIVKLKPEFYTGATNLVEGPQPDGWDLKILRKFWSDGLYSVGLPQNTGLAPADNLFKTLEELRNNPKVEFRYFDEISSREDKLINSTDQGFAQGSGGWHLRDTSYEDELYVSTAWDTTRGHENVVIAVVDTGIRSTHNDFDVPPTGYPNPSNPKIAHSWSFNGGSSNDTDGHGTKVAGIAGAHASFTAGNGFGVAGVAPYCRLAAVKVPLGDSTTYAERAEGIDFVKTTASNNGGRRYVMILAWTTAFSDNSLIRNAIQQANTQGVLVVAAAGDDTDEIGPAPPLAQQYPACYSWVIPVGAHKRNTLGRVTTPGTNWGSVVVMAPGENLAAPGISSDIVWTSNNSGSSLSAAIVAGIGALAWSKDYTLGGRNNFTKTNTNIKNYILNTAATHVIPGWNNKGRPWANDVLDLVT